MPVALVEDADAWTDRFRDAVNDSEAFAAAADGFAATFRFEVQPDGSFDGEAMAFTLVVEDGTCTAARVGDRETEFDFALRGAYDAWRDLLEGAVDVQAAVMGGAFAFEGSTMRLLQHRDAVSELVAAARAVDTAYAY